jgi:alpha-D-ribose 1-methylphosphonate 5-triphosphate synthase subunit PhnG
MAQMNDHEARNPIRESSRQRAMKFLAAARLEELQRPVSALVANAAITDLKPAETGMIMLRGRTGGDGQAFNMGEATLSRAVVEIAGFRGFGLCLGRAPEKARFAAIADALWQDETRRADIESAIIAPIEARLRAEKQAKASEAAATRVDFFTLVRGDAP